MKTKKITWTNPYATKRSGEDGEDGEGGEEEMDPLKTRWTEANDPKTGRMYYFHKGAAMPHSPPRPLVTGYCMCALMCADAC
jgi:hypothetical protein